VVLENVLETKSQRKLIWRLKLKVVTKNIFNPKITS